MEQLGPRSTDVVGSGPVGASEQESSSDTAAAASSGGLGSMVWLSLVGEGRPGTVPGRKRTAIITPARR